MMFLSIDGHWEVDDFTDALQSMESLYYKALPSARSQGGIGYSLFERNNHYEEWLDERNAWFVAQARYTFPEPYQFGIISINYSSPGGIDFAGIGEASKAVCEALDRIIKLFTERRLRQERDKQEVIKTRREGVRLERDIQTLNALKIDNARKILRLHREFPDMAAFDSYDQTLVALAVRDQDKISRLIAEGKIVGTEFGKSSKS
jgi:hypothetical protein